ncbi:phosphate ABC transporter permease subunit PstC [Campylobacter sp.]|uniref:phosphate ABC transporter permease subunit PstC n=1 Tax=Campylobacter sp. TaxID=205 RepID=UPI0026FCE443|nr:phosphate ABC transporter permease subunit PstC [Campylobacter sp.]
MSSLNLGLFSLKHKGAQKLVVAFLFLSSLITIVATFMILSSIILEAMKFFSKESFFGFLFGTVWAPHDAFLDKNAQFGSVGLFFGTFYISLIAIVTAFPIGIFSAIYLSQYASKRARALLKPVLEILAGVPSVVYGFFAAIFVAPFTVKIAEFFGLNASYNNALSAGVVMGIMIIPMISSLCDDSISLVPKRLQYAALSLGLTKEESICFVVLPSAMPGIIGACLLGLSRALGETMIVVMAASLRVNLSLNPLEDMTTVTVKIVEVLSGDQEFNNSLTLSAFALGITLFALTFIINLIAVLISRNFQRKYKISNL